MYKLSVTSVGGTTEFDPELSANPSSGGFPTTSRRLATRSTVSVSTSTLLVTHVSTQSRNYVIIRDAQLGTVSGTPCASPIFAGIIALLNDALVAAGRPVLGFLNPLPYSNPSALSDIVIGNYPGCGTSGSTHPLVGILIVDGSCKFTSPEINAQDGKL
ncbi:hypothetical protein CERSUDRAFT_89076 [Gelatoporia subvermispora B]|uniref:Peptidase S53 domain-containing protein n=1 Tax=Ceriporiopsis subvermispora (strain B) TaxID=914234 RepID=M2QXY1_CERS8|nr:hypothetical protein CERSUDRAFT_89076 [Gelatoporia subvermispora B]